MDDIKDILLDGEEVLWTGRPDLSVAKVPAPFWRRKLAHLGWLAVTLIIVAASVLGTNDVPKYSLVFNTVAVIGIIGMIPGIATFIDFKDSREDPSKHRYILTDRRLIACLDEVGETRQVFAGSAVAIVAYKKDPPGRLNIFYGQSEDEFLSLVGLPDIDDIEQMVTEILAPRSNKQ